MFSLKGSSICYYSSCIFIWEQLLALHKHVGILHYPNKFLTNLENLSEMKVDINRKVYSLNVLRLVEFQLTILKRKGTKGINKTNYEAAD